MVETRPVGFGLLGVLVLFSTIRLFFSPFTITCTMPTTASVLVEKKKTSSDPGASRTGCTLHASKKHTCKASKV